VHGRLLFFKRSGPAGDRRMVVTEAVRKTSGPPVARPIHSIQPAILAGFRQSVVYSSYPQKAQSMRVLDSGR